MATARPSKLLRNTLYFFPSDVLLQCCTLLAVSCVEIEDSGILSLEFDPVFFSFFLYHLHPRLS